MTGIISTGVIPRLLLPGISNLFGLEYNQYPDIVGKVFEKKMSKRNFEEAIQMVGMGMAEKKGQGSPIQLTGKPVQGYARRTFHDVWSKAVKITKEAFDDDLYQNYTEVIAKQLAKSMFHTRQTLGTAFFNNGTSTSAPYLGADGKALLATDHPIATTTFSNLSSSDLSELALENARIAMKGWVGTDGLIINPMVKGLMVPVNNSATAHRILKSPLRSGTTDNDTNYLKDAGIVPAIWENPFLTVTTSWFLLTDIAGLVYYEREGETARYYEENETFDHVYVMYNRFAFDHYDPHAVYGHLT